MKPMVHFGCRHDLNGKINGKLNFFDRMTRIATVHCFNNIHVSNNLQAATLRVVHPTRWMFHGASAHNNSFR